MNITFLTVEPNSGGVHGALGVGYLAAYAQKRLGRKYALTFNHEWIDFDPLVTAHDREAAVRLQEADLIAISCMTTGIAKLTCFMERFSDSFSAPVIIGGPHVSTCGHWFPRFIDLVISGEGEKRFAQVIECFMNDKNIHSPDILGIPCVHSNKGARDGIRCTDTENNALDHFDPPDRRLSSNAVAYDHVYGAKRCATLVTSRGCPHRCAFCSSHLIWGRRVRFHSAAYVVREIEQLISDYDCDLIKIMDDNFSLRPSRLEAIIKGLENKNLLSRIKFTCSARAETFTPEIADLLRRLNVIRVAFGFEFGSNTLIQFYKGGRASVSDNLRALHLCQSSGISPLINLMAGNPNESEEDVRDCFKYIDGLSCFHYQVGIAVPFPGTEYWQHAVESQIIKLDAIDWKRFYPVVFYPNPDLNVTRMKQQIEKIYYLNKQIHPERMATILFEEMSRRPSSPVRV